jgi:hypothetical protein
MQVIIIVSQLIAVLAVLFAVKAVVLFALDTIRAVAREREHMVRALVAGAAVGAALGLAAAMRADLNGPLMMLGTATSVVLGQTYAAIFVGMHRKQLRAFVALDVPFARYSKAQ